MIYTTMTALEKYCKLSKNFNTAIRFLMQNDLTKLEIGSHRIDGENVFVNRFDYETLPASDLFYEAHEQYADIHVLLSGSEKIRVAQSDEMKIIRQDEAADFLECQGSYDAELSMESGKVCIVFPQEAHMVKLQKDRSSDVKKAVFKVRI